MDVEAINCQLLTPARLRWVMDVGESTEAEWREQKAIAHFSKGRVIRYSPAAVLGFIARNTIKARGLKMEDRGWKPDDVAWARIERLMVATVEARLAGIEAGILKRAA